MKNIAFIGLLIAIIFIGGYIILSGSNKTPTPTTEDDTAQRGEGSPSAQIISEYQGKVLAGSTAPFLEFIKTDYEKAISEGKIIILDFYANWCPICRAEAPTMDAGFSGLTTDKVVGFRVNFKDSETDKDEEALAKEFKIPYQHTKIILKNGREFSRSLDSWTKETFDSEIAKALQ